MLKSGVYVKSMQRLGQHLLPLSSAANMTLRVRLLMVSSPSILVTVL